MGGPGRGQHCALLPSDIDMHKTAAPPRSRFNAAAVRTSELPANPHVHVLCQYMVSYLPAYAQIVQQRALQFDPAGTHSRHPAVVTRQESKGRPGRELRGPCSGNKVRRVRAGPGTARWGGWAQQAGLAPRRQHWFDAAYLQAVLQTTFLNEVLSHREAKRDRSSGKGAAGRGGWGATCER